MKNNSAKLEPAIIERIHRRLELLYAENADACLNRILQSIERYQGRLPTIAKTGWTERDVVLITYGDQVRQADRPSLATLCDFLSSHQLDKLIRTLHILPFFPSSSDDGFSVVDYRAVDPELGDWPEVRALGQSFELMFDLVLNHVSSHSDWFQKYLAGQGPYNGYFIEESSSTDLSTVARPRNLPLLTAFDTAGGERYLWTTFSADQLDLNFANPDVLVEMLDIFLFYIQQGARIIRLDAIAYLWKQVGTACIHLPRTHEIVKLFRDMIEAVAPHVVLLTETNVPHAENISYFGDGDEAHMVYQFSLPPLLLYTMLSGNAQPLVDWLADIEFEPAGTTYLNFTASHDGIGLRPLEGLIPKQQLEWLVDQIQLRGGLVSSRQSTDGTTTPYELNVSYFSAMADPAVADPGNQLRRFLTSQGIMLSLRGMPAVYFHSLFGTENDRDGAHSSGKPRRINRRKFWLNELNQQLSSPDSIATRVFSEYQKMLSVRRKIPAFHPDAEQHVWRTGEPWLIAFLRHSLDGNQQILVLANAGDEEQPLDLRQLGDVRFGYNLLTGESLPSNQQIIIEPWSLVWLEAV